VQPFNVSWKLAAKETPPSAELITQALKALDDGVSVISEYEVKRENLADDIQSVHN